MLLLSRVKSEADPKGMPSALTSGNLTMGLFLWIIVGWFVGLIANRIMGVKGRGSLIVIWLIGIMGALLGVFLGSAFGVANLSHPDLQSAVIAGGGSVVLLAAYRAVKGVN